MANTSQKQKYDFADWRERMGFTKLDAEKVLGVSQGTWFNLEKSGEGYLVYVWACIGIELYRERQIAARAA